MIAPHAEQALVGAVLLEPSILVELRDLLDPADLTSEPLRAILLAAEHLHADGKTVDHVTVAERLASSDSLLEVGGMARLAEIVANTFSTANWRAYAATVRTNARTRRAAVQMDRFRDRLGNEDIDLVLAEAREWVESATAGRAARGAWPSPLDLTAMARAEPLEPGFIVEGWVPAGAATLMSGHGGVGKSAIALHLAAAIALGKQWNGVPTQQSPVLFLSAEDRSNVLHWRLSNIARHLGVGIAELGGRLHLVDLVGHDVVLWQSGCLKSGTSTPAFDRLRRTMRDTGAEVLIVDGISDTFAGSEIARAEVRAYIASLLSLIDGKRGALILVGHVDKASANGNGAGNGYSGSTAWHNSVRSRWYLRPDTPAPGSSDLLLEQQKSNHGVSGASLRLAWDSEARMFLGREVVPVTRTELRARDLRQQDSIIAAMRALDAAGDYCPAAATGQRTAYHVLAQRLEFDLDGMPDNRVGKRRFWAHIEKLRAMGTIRESSIRRSDRHRITVLEVASQENCSESGAGNA